MSFYLSYIKAFKNFADSILEESTEFIQIGNYANLLTTKANELIYRAGLNKRINLASLQKDLFEAGGTYIKKYSAKFSKDHASEAAAIEKLRLFELNKLRIVETGTNAGKNENDRGTYSDPI